MTCKGVGRLTLPSPPRLAVLTASQVAERAPSETSTAALGARRMYCFGVKKLRSASRSFEAFLWGRYGGQAPVREGRASPHRHVLAPGQDKRRRENGQGRVTIARRVSGDMPRGGGERLKKGSLRRPDRFEVFPWGAEDPRAFFQAEHQPPAHRPRRLNRGRDLSLQNALVSPNALQAREKRAHQND